MTSKAELLHIGRWLQRVRRSTSAGKEDVTAEQLADYTLWLAQDFPMAVFNDQSAKSVIDAGEFFPKWAILRAHLTEWHDQHPSVPRLPASVPSSLQDHIDELRDNGAYFRRIADERAQARADWSDPAKVRASVRKIGDDHPMRDMLRSLLAGLVKKHAPENLDQIPPGWAA